ncbi:hypothetical protein [Verticiella sediminum]|uniref:hypothetical protein n=1 Tax=Verticiella sediminum TaxID=1247510 RepID=UPI00147962FD|nr:hypothetical protein [Verticiella sediminum]
MNTALAIWQACAATCAEVHQICIEYSQGLLIEPLNRLVAAAKPLTSITDP